jgi:hypothetical protein
MLTPVIFEARRAASEDVVITDVTWHHNRRNQLGLNRRFFY